MSIYGDPAANAPVWSKYAVLLGGLAATTPTHPAAFTLNESSGGTVGVTNEWDIVGALDDDSPFDSGEESIEVTDHSAAGLGVYAKTHKNQQERVTFTALESTLITLGLVYDNSSLTEAAGAISGKLKLRDPSKTFKIAFHRENAIDCERRVSENFAQIDTITRSGAEKSLYSVTVMVVPDATTTPPTVYDYYLGPKA